MLLFLRFLLLAPLVTGCAPITKQVRVDDAMQAIEAQKQHEAALQVRMRDLERAHRVGDPILEKAASFCGDEVKPRLGFYAFNRHSFGEEMNEATSKLYGWSEPLQIGFLYPDSPLLLAGAKAGDVLLAFDDLNAPVGKTATNELGNKLDEHLAGRDKVVVRVLRGGQELALTAIPKKSCAYPIVVDFSNDVNAWADGSRIGIAKGMLRFTQDDTELALVIAHELAHNAMGHISKRRGNSFIGLILDTILATRGVNSGNIFSEIGAGAFSQEFEAEADYAGLYMAAASGFKIEEAQTFWRRMAAEQPASIRSGHGATHPSTPYRFTAMEKTVAEIRGKQAEGKPLKPDLKHD